MKKVKLFLGYSGHCTANEKFVFIGGRDKTIKFYALFGLIKHPDQGWILYDTGYSTGFYDCTKRFPNTLYARATKVYITPADEAKSKLAKIGISTHDIKHIILTHFHADHIGGLKHFEKAMIYCSKDAYQQTNTICGYWAFSKGILKNLIPENIESRLVFIEDKAIPEEENSFGKCFDLFGDKSLLVVPLPGHARGQVGLMLQTEEKKIFLVADACWVKQNYEQPAFPSQLVRFFIDSWKELCGTIRKIHFFHMKNPDVLIVPTHCYSTTSLLVLNENELNEI